MPSTGSNHTEKANSTCFRESLCTQSTYGVFKVFFSRPLAAKLGSADATKQSHRTQFHESALNSVTPADIKKRTLPFTGSYLDRLFQLSSLVLVSLRQ